MTSRAVFFVLSAFVLGGCVQQPASPPPPPPRPIVIPTIPTATQPLQPGTPQTVHVFAATGIPLRATFIAAVNADCSSMGVVQASLVTQPSHGTVVIAPTEDYPNYPATNQRYDCNKKKAPGVMAHYTSANGYVGSDTFTLSIILPNGSPAERIFVVTVQPRN